MAGLGSSYATAGTSSGKKVMVVYFIGGVTFAEIAALRFLSEKADFPYRIIVCTTKLVNGNTLMKSLLHEWDEP